MKDMRQLDEEFQARIDDGQNIEPKSLTFSPEYQTALSRLQCN